MTPTIPTDKIIVNYDKERQRLLDSYRKLQPFRVSIGKNKWHQYETFNPAFNLRQIMKAEVVFELDSNDLGRVMRGISGIGQRLFHSGYYFELWDHFGRSPHLHLRNLDIPKEILNDKVKLRKFKKAFLLTYTPPEFHDVIDLSLCGIHLIAIEWQEHWKGKYKMKKLISCFDGKNNNSWGYKNA